MDKNSIFSLSFLTLAMYFTFRSPVIRICNCKKKLRNKDLKYLKTEEGQIGYGVFNMANCKYCNTTITVPLKKNPIIYPNKLSEKIEKRMEELVYTYNNTSLTLYQIAEKMGISDYDSHRLLAKARKDKSIKIRKRKKSKKDKKDVDVFLPRGKKFE